MATDFQCVSNDQWYADCDTPPEIRAQIISEINPKDLVSEFVRLTIDALKSQSSERAIAFYDEEVKDRNMRDFRRSCILVAISSHSVFNKFFNGRCGYRAMYWHDAKVGAAFNRYVVAALFDALDGNSKSKRSPVFTALRACSLKHEHAKIWPFFEKTFLEKGHLVVPNWCADVPGARIFDPAYPAFVVKGAFLNDTGEEGPFKACRSEELHKCGFT